MTALQRHRLPKLMVRGLAKSAAKRAVRTSFTAFKGARSAPRALLRVTVHAVTVGELAHCRKRARRARREPTAPPGGRSPLVAKAHGGGRRGTDPRRSPHRLSAVTRHACVKATTFRRGHC